MNSPKGLSSAKPGEPAVPTASESPVRGRRVTVDLGFLVPVVLLGVASLWMRAGFPVHALPEANYDDALFVREARSLGGGHWLGPYDRFTLIKGMFYPLFIAVSFAASVPLLAAEHVAYLAACAGLARLFSRAGGNVLAVVLFGLLAFNPVLWNGELNRVIREGLYICLSPACVGLAIATTFPVAGPRRRFAMPVLLGLCAGAFWLTREEGPWLLPALAAVFASGMLLPDGTGPRRRPGSVVAPWAVSLAVATASVLGVAAVNWSKYGVFVTTEFQMGAFPRAYGALARITPDHWQPYLVSPADARARAYAESPATAELAPALDGPNGRQWAMAGCQQTGAEPCPGILSGWFMWALRDAADAAGHYRTASEAQRFYGRVAAEINGACDAGRLPCGPASNGFVPGLHPGDLWRMSGAAWQLASIMARVGPENVGPRPSEGWPFALAAFADVVGPITPPAAKPVFIDGWVAGQAAVPRLQVVHTPGQAANTGLAIAPYSDPVNGKPGWRVEQFQLVTNCGGSCALEAVTADGHVVTRALASPAPDATTGMDQPLHISGVSAADPRAANLRLQALRVGIARMISGSYRTLMPPALGLAAIATLTTLVPSTRRRLPPRQVTFAWAALVAAGSRLLLLAYLNAVAIPSVNELYPSPASPFVIGFAVIGCAMGWSLLASALRVAARPGAARFAKSPD